MPPENLKAIKDQISEKLLQPGSSANVFGVGISRRDGQSVVRLYTDNNADPNLQRELAGVFGGKLPRDVTFEYRKTPRPVFAVCDARENYERPWAGMSIESDISGSNDGTIAYFFKRRSSGAIVLLSNNHVIAAFNQGIAGTDAAATGVFRKGHPKYAKLTKFEPLKSLQPNGLYHKNEVDAAIATLTDKTKIKLQMSGIRKKINGTFSESAIGAFITEVEKHGIATCRTFGWIDDEWCDFVLIHRGQGYKFVNQMRVIPKAGNFADKGDSGSLVYEPASQKAVGLLFAIGKLNKDNFPNEVDRVSNQSIDTEYALINRMERVMDIMRIDWIS